MAGDGGDVRASRRRPDAGTAGDAHGDSVAAPVRGNRPDAGSRDRLGATRTVHRGLGYQGHAFRIAYDTMFWLEGQAGGRTEFVGGWPARA